jgi:hypothetical protein
MTKDSVLMTHDKHIRKLIYKTINEVNLANLCELNANKFRAKKKGAVTAPSERGL